MLSTCISKPAHDYSLHKIYPNAIVEDVTKLKSLQNLRLYTLSLSINDIENMKTMPGKNIVWFCDINQRGYSPPWL